MEKIKKLTAENFATAGVLALLVAYPLILTDKYFNVTATKCVFFIVTVTVFFTACTMMKNRSQEAEARLKFNGFSFADKSLTAFVIIATISSLTSEYGVSAITGDGARKMGLIMIFALFFAYIFISRFYKIREREFVFFGIVAMVSAVFGLIQFIGLDPLGLLKGLSQLDRYRFIAFIGNINIYSSFICIALPLAMYMFCYSEKRKNTAFWLAVSSASFIGMLTAISDSGYIGLAAALVALGIMTAKEKRSFQRFLILIIAMLLSGGIFNLIWKTFGDPERPSSVPNDIIINPWVILAVTVICGILLAVISIFNMPKKFYTAIRILIIAATVIFIVGFISVIVWFTVYDKTSDIGILSNYFRLTERWGNGRCYVWTKSLEIYADLPLHKKLIGTGADTLVYELVERHNDEMNELFGFYFDNAHNDLIHYLVTFGITGMLAYLITVISAARSSLKSENTISRAMFLPIMAFFAQSLVNITQPITTPLFFVFLAFSQCDAYKKKDTENENTEL